MKIEIVTTKYHSITNKLQYIRVVVTTEKMMTNIKEMMIVLKDVIAKI